LTTTHAEKIVTAKERRAIAAQIMDLSGKYFGRRRARRWARGIMREAGKPYHPSEALMPGRDYDDRCDMENPEA
jgi:hypothetical protein